MLKKTSLLIVFILCFLAMPGSIFARQYESFGPISVRNQNPVYLQNLGLTPRKAAPLPHGTMEIRVDSAYSSLYEFGQDTTNSLDLDMEFWRIGLHFDYGISDSFEIGMELPLVHFNGGFLDGFIQDFHKFFGLPNGGRDQVPNNRFSYSFATNGVEHFGFPPTNLGLGDISFHLKHQLAGEDSDWPDLSWFAELKFPTGKRSRGFGSGAMDFGIGLLLDASYKRVHAHFNTGYFVLGGNDLIDGYMYNQMFSYTVAGEVSLLPTWSLIVQLNGSTPLLQRTSLEAWNGVPMDLIVGFRGEEKNIFGNTDLIWQVGFSEDVTSTGPSVDFTAFLSIGFRFGLLGRNRPEGDWIAKKE
ncbi:MAG: DUF3187 family protein [Deltaproteobacteria bacterium]|jgi:hypothetical protein|nr:DUF3187 family protein [Deltaproteobacteria bacterium]